MQCTRPSSALLARPRLAFSVLLLATLAGCSTSPNPEADQPGTADAGTSGIDAAVTPGPDADGECPSATHLCVPPTPQLWSGPVARASGTESSPPSECGGNYPTQEWQVFADIVAEGDCSCSCSGVSSGATCSSARVQGHGAVSGGLAPCSSPLGSPTLLEAKTSNASLCSVAAVADISSMRFVETSLGRVVNSGTCAPAQVSDNIVEAHFTSEDRFCASEGASAGTCTGTQICAARADNGFDEGLCIYREGDHECPLGVAYTERFLRHQTLTDERSCGACSCTGPAAGSSCGGQVQMGFAAISGGNICNTTVSTGSCEPDPWDGNGSFSINGAKYRVDFSDSAVFGCSASGGGVSGEAEGTNPVTFCCLASN